MRRLALALKEAALREHEFTGQRQPKRLALTQRSYHRPLTSH